MAVASLRVSGAVVIVAGLCAQPYLANLPSDDYLHATANDHVAQLIRNNAKLPLDPKFGYLPEALSRLGISFDSQALVFSKTSVQAPRISPRTPRAIYFNDEVAVAWIRDSPTMEIAAVDPQFGVMFYTMQAGRFERQVSCLHCHQDAATIGVPGMFVGSVFPNASGMPDRDGAIITDHRTPFADRWGGWYVTAAHGEQRDRANGVALDPAEPHALHSRQNLTSLARDFDTSAYLLPTSDIVALMTFEHQTQMTNLITRVAWESRNGQPPDRDIEALVRYMTFADEAPLKEPIEGVSTFTDTFPKRGPRDSKGRSLRDFDLQTRLFKYPLSYLVYSAQFDALPLAVRQKIWQRVFAQLKDRPEALEILRDTKPGI